MRWAPWLSWMVAACGDGGELSTEQLSQVVAAQQPTLKVCYDAELERLPTAHELRFEAAIHIAPSGRVTAVEIDEGAGPEPLLSCVRKTILRWTFPRAEEETHTSLPLVFKPEVVRSGPTLDEMREIIKEQIEAKPPPEQQQPAPGPR